MNDAVVSKLKISLNKKVVKGVIAGIAVLLVAGISTTYILNKSKPAANSAQVEQTAKVARGNFSVAVTGSGPVVSSEKADISPKTGGTITKVYIKEGDKVKAGDVLYEMDDSTAKLSLEKAKANLAQTELAQRNNSTSVSKLTVKAPFSGQISSIQVKEDDTIGKNASVLTLIDYSRLKLTVPFNASNMGGVSTGSKAVVNIQSLMQSVQGTVTYISNASFSTTTGGELYNVEITVDNPGSLKDGMKANADIKTTQGIVSSTGSGTLSFVNSQVVKSEPGGTVTKVNVKEGQYVKSGETLVLMKNDDLVQTGETNEAKLMDLRAQVESAQNELTYYKVSSPIDGTITKQNEKVGSVVKSGDVLAAISNSALMECSISIDELDISKVKLGQKASLVVDALPETSTKPLQGEVSKIAVEGTGSNGVTTYPVTIKILDTKGLIGGMNSSVEISIESKQNALYVPIEAVQKIQGKTYLMVKNGNGSTAADGKRPENNGQTGEQQANRQASDSSPAQGQGSNRTQGSGQGNRNSGQTGTRSSSQNSSSTSARSNSNLAQYYANSVRTPVEVGMSNETYIEIKSGVSEGDVVMLPPRATSQGGTGGNAMGGNPIGGFMGGAARPPQATGGNR